MKTSDTRFLTTHAGSLPRPKSLTALHAKAFKGEEVDGNALKSAVDDATRDIVAKQVDAGVDIGNNGEMGRESFFTYVQHRMSGFAGTSTRPVMADLAHYPGFLQYLTSQAMTGDSVNLLEAPQAVADVVYEDPGPLQEEISTFKSVLDARDAKGEPGFVEPFMTAPSPGIIAAAMTNAHYDSLDDYVIALAAALRTEYAAIIDAGFVLQIDAPDLAMERHTLFADKPLTEFLDFVRLVISATNEALDGLPGDRVRHHICWGNYEGPHDADVPLNDIWPEIAQSNASAFLLSMANPRHAHEYHCFENGELPANCTLVAGVIDTTTNYVEHPAAVADRLDLIARAVGDPRRIMAGTDCGFETAAGFVAVAEDVVWAKLKALADGAQLASRRWFG